MCLLYSIFVIILIKVSLSLSNESSLKVEKTLRTALDTNGTANIILTFNQTTLQTIRNVESLKFKSRGSKIAYLKYKLETLAKDTQKYTRLLLHDHRVSFESYWISNQLFVPNAAIELVEALSDISEVLEIRKEKIIYIDELIEVNYERYPGWALGTINAFDAWEFLGGPSEAGRGVVVGTISTGVRFTHESLAANYRSSYGWYDPIRSTPTPVDENGHGTHTMGTIVGSDGIGVAPGAQWITCRGCLSSQCEERHLFACGQWITCPTLPSGESSDCEKAPNVVSNSWTSGEGDAWYSLVINAWKTANIIPVFSIGNSGPICGSVKSPGDDKNVIGVGATDSVDNAAYFSSRGPSLHGVVKPDVSAPGQNIRSAWFSGDSAYNTLSGTSTACPHVAGLAALVLSKIPELSYDEVKKTILEYSDKISIFPETTCGGTSQDDIPNNIYGYGRINAREAVVWARR